MIYVCDAIMGTGKSSSAIQYMNDHPEKKYIYITPFLDEAARIRDACTPLNFIEPSGDSKLKDTELLVEQGANITTTHQAFRKYKEGILEKIRDKNYTLIMDECVDFVNKVTVNAADVKMLEDAGYVRVVGDSIYMTGKKYEGMWARNLMSLIGFDRTFVRSGLASDSGFYWELSPDLLEAFEDVFVLTYMFTSSNLFALLEANNLTYQYIGVERDERGYRFSFTEIYVPEYTRDIKSKVKIFDNKEMNKIGQRRTALSSSWYKNSSKERIDTVRKNVNNYFRNYNKEYPAEQRMWSTYSNFERLVKGKGYSSGFVSFNAKATNAFREKTRLAYMVNVFLDVNEKIFLQSQGVEISDDDYALSTMVQWIWRSAIREGKEIEIYIPSSRMRGLLEDWLDKVEKGYVYGKQDR